jgi:hypothetical protein
MAVVRKATRNNADQFISKRLDFKTGGALSGYSKETDKVAQTGQLPSQYEGSFYRSTYRVYSYVTPIAWWSEESGWERPEVYYSNTTSHHQGKCPMTTPGKCAECGEFAPEYNSKTHGDECSQYPGSDAWKASAGF